MTQHSFSINKLVSVIAFLDPASGKQEVKKTRARSAIVVVGQDEIDRIFCLYAWADRCSTSAILEKVYYVNQTFRPDKFGIEANAQQALFADLVRRDSILQGEDVPIENVTQPTTITKEFRVRTYLQPVISTGRLFLQPSQKELKQEIITFPMNTLKDMVDALASAVHMLPPVITKKERSAENESYISYLRSTGASVSEIQQASYQANREADIPRVTTNPYKILKVKSS